VDEKGRIPAKEFLLSLTKKERAKISAYVMELKLQGHNLRRPMADYLGEGIYELRPQRHRVFYFFFMKNNAVLVHAIRKKTDKIPKEDMALCVKRKEQVKSEKNLTEWEKLL
jgi:phage-related protein